MPTEIISGLWLGDINDSLNKSFLKDNLIDILINCTTNYGYIDSIETKKLRIPLSYNLLPGTDLILLKKNHDKIVSFILKNIESSNILIFCYDGLRISPLIIALFLIKYGEISKDNIRSILRSKNEKICFDVDLSDFTS
tara:strand:- start:112 stop:528 length:417 start_codon:yes stop_codon:yes gene_type:complete